MWDESDLYRRLKSQASDRALFESAKEYSLAYLAEAEQREVFPRASAISNLDHFEEDLPAEPGDPAGILGTLHRFGSPATVSTIGGRYFGFVNGSSMPAAMAAHWLADVWDQNTALYVMSPIGACLESVCERWMLDLLGLPAGTVAGFVSGTSTATICGLAAGRNKLLEKLGWDVSAKGLYGAPRIRLVAGQQAHATVFKAVSLLGLGRENVELAPVDSQGRILPESLPPLDDKTLLVLQAGNVNSGSFDPFAELCPLARQQGAWSHVDGAFGLWCAASPRLQGLTRGVELADSWSVDAHKTLNAPYDCGVILCRDRQALTGSMQATGSYIQYGENRDCMLYTPEMSRRARAIEMWATLKTLGRRGVGELMEGLHEGALNFASQLRGRGFRILNEVAFNQVMVACETPEKTKSVMERIQRSGECWCGGAVWNGEPVIRISVCSWATSREDVSRTVRAFAAARDSA
jgi:glutamate/tyrosine decarboxylase-like PLP-dependent enzyme